MRRTERCKAFPIAEQIIVAAYCQAEEHDGECEEGHRYQDYSAKTANLYGSVSRALLLEGQWRVVQRYEDTYLWVRPLGPVPARVRVHEALRYSSRRLVASSVFRAPCTNQTRETTAQIHLQSGMYKLQATSHAMQRYRQRRRLSWCLNSLARLCYHELALRHDDILSVVSCPFQRSIGSYRWQVDMDAKRG
jgi:hypothetical protein